MPPAKMGAMPPSAVEPLLLTLHVLNDDVVNLAQARAVFEYLPGLVGVKVELDQVLVPHRQQAVAGDVLRDIVVNVVLREVSPSMSSWVSKRYSSIPCSPL